MLWIWLCIVVSLALIEIFTVNLTTIWFVLSGLVSMLLSVFIDCYLLQFGIFIIGGFLLMIFTRSYLLNKVSLKNVRTNLDWVIGMTGIVTEAISKFSSGEVLVDGKRWTAVSNSDIDVKREVIIKEIEGVKVVVEEVMK